MPRDLRSHLQGLVSRVTGALAGRDADVMRWCVTAWHRLVRPSGRNGGPRSAMKLCDLTSGPEGMAVWPVQWAEWGDPGGRRSLSEAGVLEGLTRLGNRLLLRINVDGNRRTASLEWDPPPSVGDVEAVLQANLGAELRALGRLEVPIRAHLDSRASAR